MNFQAFQYVRMRSLRGVRFWLSASKCCRVHCIVKSYIETLQSLQSTRDVGANKFYVDE